MRELEMSGGGQGCGRALGNLGKWEWVEGGLQLHINRHLN